MKYILITLLILQNIDASEIERLELNNNTKETIFTLSEEDLDVFLLPLTRLSSTDIPYDELIAKLKTGTDHIWKMRLAHNILISMPSNITLEDLRFLRDFGKKFKSQYPGRDYEAYKILIRDLKENIERPARSFRAERKGSFLGSASDSDA